MSGTIQKTLLGFVGAIAVAAIGAVLYYYFIVVPIPSYVVNAPPGTEAVPDNTVAAGPITALNQTSVTILKQDNASVTFALTAGTQILSSGQDGKPSGTLKGSDLKVGMIVLITPSHTIPTEAGVVLVIPPPAQQ